MTEICGVISWKRRRSSRGMLHDDDDELNSWSQVISRRDITMLTVSTIQSVASDDTRPILGAQVHYFQQSHSILK